MKLLLSLFVAFAAVNVQAADTLGECAPVDHHGTYLAIYSVGGKVVLETSNDGEGPAKQYQITSFEAGYKKVALKDQVQKMTDAIKENVATTNNETSPVSAGEVIITAKKGKKTLLLNLNRMNGQNFLVQDGKYIEELKCSLPE